MPPERRFPECIRRLGPLSGVFFDPKTQTVTITQGSGFGHWGLVVTDKDVALAHFIDDAANHISAGEP